MIGQWEVPFELFVESVGTLTLNAAEGQRFLLVPAECSARLPVRVTTDDDVPQGDGQIPHRRWRSGYSAHLAVQLWKDDGPACGADLVEMLDLLGCYLNPMVRTGTQAGSPNARLIWTPTGADDRMFDRIQLRAEPFPSLDAGGITKVEFDIDTLLPYYMATTEDDTVIALDGSASIVNGGNTDFYPVIRVNGPTSAFTITNNSVLDPFGNPLQIVYDDSLPGADAIGNGDYVEIITFLGTAYLNGNSANLKAGIDMRQSDFWPLAPECQLDGNPNDIEITGADALVLSNWAWA